MQNSNSKSLIVLIFSALLLSVTAFSQNKNRIGVAGGIDKASTWKTKPAFGVSFERMVNKHNSAEIGFYYRTTINNNLIVLSPVGPNFVMTEQYFIQENFVSIPIVYNYRSNAINVSVGPSFDIYSGWKEKKHTTNPPASSPPLQEYKFDRKLFFGAIAKISKTIRAGERIAIEPFVYINPVFTPYTLYSGNFSETRQYYGAAIAMKYIF